MRDDHDDPSVARQDAPDFAHEPCGIVRLLNPVNDHHSVNRRIRKRPLMLARKRRRVPSARRPVNDALRRRRDRDHAFRIRKEPEKGFRMPETGNSQPGVIAPGFLNARRHKSLRRRTERAFVKIVKIEDVSAHAAAVVACLLRRRNCSIKNGLKHLPKMPSGLCGDAMYDIFRGRNEWSREWR